MKLCILLKRSLKSKHGPDDFHPFSKTRVNQKGVFDTRIFDFSKSGQMKNPASL